jgi:isopenicillin N synthase-like dioxygenase
MSSATQRTVGLGLLAVAALASLWWMNRRKEEKGDGKAKGTDTLNLPTIDFTLFFNKDKDPAAYEAECAKVADALHRFGVVIVKDPRVAEADNNRFLDMMENYFEMSDGLRDARPAFSYQVGVTPANIEKPRDHCKIMGAYGPDNKPLSPCPPEFDPKWRFFWRVGPVPKETKFPSLNADAVIPPEFPQWKEVMDMWGGKMTTALFTLAEMAATGFKLPTDSFTSRMQFGPHLLAPTGSDYKNYGKEGTVLAGYHYDLNFLTIHGKSRYPGLHIWTREGVKKSVVVPDGCLLVQAGKQIEYLTGGHVLAGFHEVVVSPGTVKVIESRKAQGKSLWRVSSTCFGHIQSDQKLETLGHIKTQESAEKFPPKYAGDQVREELMAISLDRTSK